MSTEYRAGGLPTVNQDDYPGLQTFWNNVWQLNHGSADVVVARAYGATPEEVNSRAKHIASGFASLADAQAEIARLRGALEEINRTTFDDDANRIAHGALQK